MNYSLKLLIPIGLGLLAAVFNWAALAGRTRPIEFVSVNKEISPGAVISFDDMTAISIPADLAERLKPIAYLYEERESLEGQRILRRLEEGDLVFQRDIASADGAVPEFQEYGEQGIPISFGQRVNTPVDIGSLVEFRIRKLEEANEYFTVGPFRVIAIDNRIAYDPELSQQEYESVTVAFPPGDVVPDSPYDILQRYLDARNDQPELPISLRIVAAKSAS